MGNNWPSHVAHPFGAKPKLMILISDKNGSAIPDSSSLLMPVDARRHAC
jgi:hypothetical protein